MNGRYDQRRGATKTFNSGYDGTNIVWVVKKPEKIRLCECGNRYIKTRRGQKVCLYCVYGHRGGNLRKYP